MALSIFSLGRKIRGEEPMFPEKGGGGGKQTTTTKMEPWQPAQAQMKDVLAQAKALYQKNGGLDAQAIQREIPSLTPEMAQSLVALSDSGQLDEVANNLNKYTGNAGAFLDQSADYLNQSAQMAKEFAGKDLGITGDQINNLSSQLYDNETVRSQKQELQQDVQEQYEGAVQQLNQRASTAGAMGSSRAGVAQGVMFGKNQQNLTKGESDIMNNARNSAQTAALATLQGNQSARINQYSQGIQALSNVGSTFGNMGTNLASQYQQGEIAKGNLIQQGLQNKYQAAQVNQQMQAAQQETDYQNQLANRNAGQENFNNYAAITAQMGGMGNSGSSTAPSAGGASKGQSALGGAMAGAAAGATIGGPWGAVAGGVIGGVSGLFSDAELKKDIKLKGKTKKGDAVYDWNWNEKGKEKGMKGKATGVLAQRSDEAVSGKKQGALMVDYDKTSVKPKYKK